MGPEVHVQLAAIRIITVQQNAKKICADFQLFQKVKVCLLGIRDDKSGEESTYIAREFSYLCIEFLTELRRSAVHCIVTSKYFNYMRSWSLEVEGRVESCKWKDRFSWELRLGSDADLFISRTQSEY